MTITDEWYEAIYPHAYMFGKPQIFFQNGIYPGIITSIGRKEVGMLLPNNNWNIAEKIHEYANACADTWIAEFC